MFEYASVEVSDREVQIVHKQWIPAAWIHLCQEQGQAVPNQRSTEFDARQHSPQAVDSPLRRAKRSIFKEDATGNKAEAFATNTAD